MNTPVLLLAFNRPDLTRVVLNRLREAGIKRLFVALDGPRAEKSGERELCQEVCSLIEGVGWAEVQLLAREENLGCGLAVSGAISWFFEQVEAGIIVEDDCLPDPSFFQFCDAMMQEYANDPKVWSVAGSSLIPEELKLKGSHYFSKYSGIWGWATWRRAWESYRYDLNYRSAEEWRAILAARSMNAVEFRYWHHILDLMLAGKIDTWDFQVQFCAWEQEALHVTSCRNLVENIGFRADATHTKEDSPLAHRSVEPNLPPYDFKPVVQDPALDRVVFGEKMHASPELAEWLFSDTQEKELLRQLEEVEREVGQLREHIGQRQTEAAALRGQVDVLEKERLRLGRELEGFYGLTGAWRCLKKTRPGKSAARDRS